MSKTAEKMRTDLGDANDLVCEAYDRAQLAWMAVSHLFEREGAADGSHTVGPEEGNALVFALGSVLQAVRDARSHLDEALR
ncbi:hypothetical protein [Antarcticirhabdus aurantiaca]|uniref:Uncharacterized protein n=1 Tax=Antarcticirhabdus aurantiaca TaxID=2606717 RepID=A0ACD4NVV3_9HYPH|nr:hypothetical protein OXU80_12495 [Jeongeuplla avenae]